MQAETNARQHQRTASGMQVRPLHASDESAVLHALDGDHGYGIFITDMVLAYGFQHAEVRLWGQFGRGDDGQYDLTGILMFSGASATIFTPPGVDADVLIALALQEKPSFIMGRDDLMAATQERAAQTVTRIESHHFAALPPRRFTRPEVTLAHDIRIRRAELRDVDALARLYFGASSFEHLTFQQVRNVMLNRVTRLRTTVAARTGEILAAASTSAESYSGALIGGVWTAPWARGRGLSTAVVSNLIAELLRERKRPYLFYLTDNGPAEHIYAKLGFRVTGAWRIVYLGT